MSPPNFYFSEPVMSWGNIKYVPKTWGHALHSADFSFSDISATKYRKMVKKLGIFNKKQVFDINFWQTIRDFCGLLTLNHCMILQFVIVCISFDSV